MWATQAQIDEDIQDEIQELKNSHQMGWRSINRCTKTGDAKLIGILLNFVLLLFNSKIVPTTGNKSNLIYKTYMIMSHYYKKKSLKPLLKICPLPLI